MPLPIYTFGIGSTGDRLYSTSLLRNHLCFILLFLFLVTSCAPARVENVSEPTPLVTGAEPISSTPTKTKITTSTIAPVATKSINSPGRIVFTYWSGEKFEIHVMDIDGRNEITLSDPNFDSQYPSVSPDGKIIAFSLFDEENWDNNGIYFMNSDGENMRKFYSSKGGSPNQVNWSPDGTKLIFANSDGAQYDIFSINIDGTDLTQLTNTPDISENDPSWSPDGKQIVFVSRGGASANQIYVMDSDGGNRICLSNNNHDEWNPSWSPNGREIAYFSSYWDPMRAGIYIMDIDGENKKQLIDMEEVGEDSPAWSIDGRRIVFTCTYILDDEICLINSDGSDFQRITNRNSRDYVPVWMP